VAPDWRHPGGGESVGELIAALSADGPAIRPIPDA
jgi:hypothetical protein